MAAYRLAVLSGCAARPGADLNAASVLSTPGTKRIRSGPSRWVSSWRWLPGVAHCVAALKPATGQGLWMAVPVMLAPRARPIAAGPRFAEVAFQ